MNERVIYQHDAERRLKEWGPRIKELKVKAKTLEANARKSFYERIEKLLVAKRNVESELKKMKSAGTEAWVDVKIGVDKALEEIDNGFKSAIRRLKEIKEKAEA
jgi:cell fate (sporulation/competence/biofilm development) regulator YmcA (YheA/YmcA/DUF963 family)